MTFQLDMNGFSLDKQDNNYDVVIIGGGQQAHRRPFTQRGRNCAPW